MGSFIKGRIKSVKYATKGAFFLITTEHSIMLQLSAGIAVTAIGFVIDITKFEWITQTLTIGIVLCAEGLNTAIEGVCDFVHPEHHEKIGKIKDVSAGAVVFTAIAALVIFCIIYLPYFTA
jgi:diacylglycerol kinase (ATP)